jgi:hypothetical protein
MRSFQEDDGLLDPVTAQRSLGERLQTLGTTLQQHDADPALMMETAVAALALTRTWLEPDIVLAALAAVGQEQLAWWERELVENETYVVALCQAVRAELQASRRKRRTDTTVA